MKRLSVAIASAAVMFAAITAGCGRTTPHIVDIKAGDRVTLASGLSLTMPAGGGWVSFPTKDEGGGVDLVNFGFRPPGWARKVGVESFYHPDKHMAIGLFLAHGRIIARSADGTVAMYWVPTGRVRPFMVLTRLPGKPCGSIRDDGSFRSAAAAWREAALLWQRLSIQGASLPPLGGAG